ncbi:NAD(P)-dependent oxidoreductase [Peptoniphilus stercorisuis]|uniref:D-3-phosphoglycerate dehydrogenase n=1 Tax=Peptoniphilus stercorisuis TaxID=1436965 RepID=A0ABS4KAL4_9FIRM|nr:NAD(P)-dependent oxidoreductase [Peptoniphilus stercorisuis]MBP2024819.1 D-3-phosphoglycerate dehydrogenase [Peptoniphilus stercorisuis]
MKILINNCYYSPKNDFKEEIEILKNAFENNIEIEIYDYKNKKEFIEKLQGTDILMTNNLNLDEEILKNAKNLELISLMQNNYQNVDIEFAKKKNIVIALSKEDFEVEVAESALAMAFALNRGIKFYDVEIELFKIWDYTKLKEPKTMEEMSIGIIGYNRFGRYTSKKFAPLVKDIMIYDSEEIKSFNNEKIVDFDYLLENSDIIINHMDFNEGEFFNLEKFKKMKEKPLFIDLSEKMQINKEDLISSLNKGYIKGAGLDSIDYRKLEIYGERLFERSNVIITPNSSFYSKNSMDKLRKNACLNIINYINKNYKEIPILIK